MGSAGAKREEESGWNKHVTKLAFVEYTAVGSLSRTEKTEQKKLRRKMRTDTLNAPSRTESKSLGLICTL